MIATFGASGSTHRRAPVRMNATILWVIAVILVVAGIVQLVQGQILWGLLLIVVGALVGPGGVSVFRTRS